MKKKKIYRKSRKDWITFSMFHQMCFSKMHIASEVLTQFAIFRVHLPLHYQPLELMLLNSFNRVIFAEFLILA